MDGLCYYRISSAVKIKILTIFVSNESIVVSVIAVIAMIVNVVFNNLIIY